MGICASSEGGDLTPEQRAERLKERAQAKALDSQLNKDQSTDRAINKLLLLGAGESGKSTLFKQMITIYGKGFSEEDRKGYRVVIYNNIVTSMKAILNQMEEWKIELQGEGAAARTRFNNVKVDDTITPAIGNDIITLWADADLQKVYQRRAEYQLTDSAEYVTFLSLLDFSPVICASRRCLCT